MGNTTELKLQQMNDYLDTVKRNLKQEQGFDLVGNESSKSFWIASQSSMNTFWSMEGMCRQYPKDIRRHCFATVILSSADAEMSERKNFIC